MSRASSNAQRGIRVVANILKAVALGLILGVVILLLWRIFSTGAPKEMKPLSANDALVAAYAEKGDSLYIFTQDQKSITTAERNRGYYAVTECKIIPDAEQIQIIFRYNNSTVKKVCEEKGISPIPDVSTQLFHVSLNVQTDLTPENKDDNGGNISEAVAFTRIEPMGEPIHGQRTLYNYYRYTFDFKSAGISLSSLLESGELLAIYADVYYIGDVNYERQSDGTLFLYDYAAERETVRLSGKDIEAIEAFKE